MRMMFNFLNRRSSGYTGGGNATPSYWEVQRRPSFQCEDLKTGKVVNIECKVPPGVICLRNCPAPNCRRCATSPMVEMTGSDLMRLLDMLIALFMVSGALAQKKPIRVPLDI